MKIQKECKISLTGTTESRAAEIAEVITNAIESQGMLVSVTDDRYTDSGKRIKVYSQVSESGSETGTDTEP